VVVVEEALVSGVMVVLVEPCQLKSFPQSMILSLLL
jgi:hypothetical protein